MSHIKIYTDFQHIKKKKRRQGYLATLSISLLQEFLNLCSGWISVYVDSDRAAIFADLSGLIISNRPKSVTN